MPRGVPGSGKAAEKKAVSTNVGEVPSVATSGQTYDTTVDNGSLELPLPHGAPSVDPGESLNNPHLADIQRLHNFLMLNYPQEMNRTNRQAPESPVQVAMRLLSGTHNSRVPTCDAKYCNLPANHHGDHGWVSTSRL